MTYGNAIWGINKSGEFCQKFEYIFGPTINLYNAANILL